MNQEDLVFGAAKWIRERSGLADFPEDTLAENLDEGRLLLADLETGRSPAGSVDSIYAAIDLLKSEGPARYEVAVRLYDFLFQKSFEDLDEKGELLIEASLHCWRFARCVGAYPEALAWRRRLREVADETTPIKERIAEFVTGEDQEFTPELFTFAEALVVCDSLLESLQSSPASAMKQAKDLEFAIANSDELCGDGARFVILGEIAVVIGVAHRQVLQLKEARSWFDKAEELFKRSGSSEDEIVRVDYHRLASLLEERRLDDVFSGSPALIERCRSLGLVELELKVSFLPALVLMERGQFLGATVLHEKIADRAARHGFTRLLAYAYANLAHIFGMMGDAEKALPYMARGNPILRDLNDGIGLAKLQWGLAGLLAKTGRLTTSLEAYESARSQLVRLGMRADAAGISLVIAELHLELGDDAAALASLLEALPIIEEFGLLPESEVAVVLLRNSMRQKRINRSALGQVRKLIQRPIQPADGHH